MSEVTEVEATQVSARATQLFTAPSVNMVAIQVQSNNGIMCQVVIRPDLAITLAGLIHEHAKQAKSGIVIAQAIPPNGKPHA